MPDLLLVNEQGLYCAAGDFYIDPWRTVSRAVITHAHSDHARSGMSKYFCARPGVGLLQARVGKDAVIHPLNYGETHSINGVQVSLHPAGHVLGAAQVRIEHRGQIWVVSGDYKLADDPTCASFEPVRCHTFITESTFALPIYRWSPVTEVTDQINTWWRYNQLENRTSAILAYSLGKSQRILASVDSSIGPLLVHQSIETLNRQYRLAGVNLPETAVINQETAKAAGGNALVVLPPSAETDKLLHRFDDVSLAMASGWMLVRGTRRRQSTDRGFVLSDHADWPGLLTAIRATGAQRILVTHGYTGSFSRYLCEQGFDASPLKLHGQTELNPAERVE